MAPKSGLLILEALEKQVKFVTSPGLHVNRKILNKSSTGCPKKNAPCLENHSSGPRALSQQCNDSVQSLMFNLEFRCYQF